MCVSFPGRGGEYTVRVESTLWGGEYTVGWRVHCEGGEYTVQTYFAISWAVGVRF